ncbi:protein rolling stone-like [Diadema setosum]|uniref:protein rolling stone-like n=1 Tax=Diadema setosum TaxID=31175 RepID=UPI003B3A71F7
MVNSSSDGNPPKVHIGIMGICPLSRNPDKFRYQIQWFLFNITTTPCIFLSVFDWWFWFYSTTKRVPTLFSVSNLHLPTAICLIEIFVTLIVVHFVHVVYPMLYLIMYFFFAVIYWAAGGTDMFGNNYIFFLLDFGNYPYIAAATVVAGFCATLLFQAILKGLYAIRVRCMDSNRTGDVSPTDEVSVVELGSMSM